MITDKSILSDIKTIIFQSKENAVRAIDHQRTLMYWHIGQRIFEEEQQGGKSGKIDHPLLMEVDPCVLV